MKLVVWRAILADQIDKLLLPAGAPEGRFHHNGQRALYACLTRDGPQTSLSRYVTDNDPPRVMAGLSVEGGNFRDVFTAAENDEGQMRENSMVRWDLALSAGGHPITWDLSDTLRSDGWDGLIYPSRQRPDLRNIVLFRWNASGGPKLSIATDPVPWNPTTG